MYSPDSFCCLDPRQWLLTDNWGKNCVWLNRNHERILFCRTVHRFLFLFYESGQYTSIAPSGLRGFLLKTKPEVLPELLRLTPTA